MGVGLGWKKYVKVPVLILNFPKLLFMKGKMMRFSKTSACIYLYEELKTGKPLFKFDIMNELDISEVTFKRYIREIKAYLRNRLIPMKIQYYRSTDCYKLVKEEPFN